MKVMKELKIGPAYDKASQLGPLVNAEHRQSVVSWIEKGIEEGAELVLDGRGRDGRRATRRGSTSGRRSSTTSSAG